MKFDLKNIFLSGIIIAIGGFIILPYFGLNQIDATSRILVVTSIIVFDSIARPIGENLLK